MAHRIDQREVVAITRNGKKVGYYVPVDKPFPAEPGEIEPEDPPDESGPIIIGRVGPSDGPSVSVRWSSSGRLSLPELWGTVTDGARPTLAGGAGSRCAQ